MPTQQRKADGVGIYPPCFMYLIYGGFNLK